MLIGFVILYLVISIGIGLYAATRVNNAADYITAGRTLPMFVVIATVFATWFGAETVLGIPATFVKEGLRRHRRGSRSAPRLCLILVGLFFARKLYRMNLLTIGDYYRQRYGRTVEVRHRLAIIALLPGLGVGADHRAGPGVQRALAGRDHAARRASLIGAVDRAALHAVRRHVVGGADRLLPDDRHRARPVYIAGCVAPDMAGGFGKVVQHAADAGKFQFWPAGGDQGVVAFVAAWHHHAARLHPAAGRVPARDQPRRTSAPR